MVSIFNSLYAGKEKKVVIDLPNCNIESQNISNQMRKNITVHLNSCCKLWCTCLLPRNDMEMQKIDNSIKISYLPC